VSENNFFEVGCGHHPLKDELHPVDEAWGEFGLFFQFPKLWNPFGEVGQSRRIFKTCLI